MIITEVTQIQTKKVLHTVETQQGQIPFTLGLQESSFLGESSLCFIPFSSLLCFYSLQGPLFKRSDLFLSMKLFKRDIQLNFEERQDVCCLELKKEQRLIIKVFSEYIHLGGGKEVKLTSKLQQIKIVSKFRKFYGKPQSDVTDKFSDSG